MTWGRGFFRFWLFPLGNLDWFIEVYITEPKTYSWLWHAPQFEVKFASGHVTTFDTSKSYQQP